MASGRCGALFVSPSACALLLATGRSYERGSSIIYRLDLSHTTLFRISFLYGFKGPAFSVDTGESARQEGSGGSIPWVCV